MIERPHYLDWLSRWQDKDVIKVLTGMRRSGKSTIMDMFRRKLVDEGISPGNTLSLNFESLEENYPLSPKELYDYLVSRTKKGERNYVFLDEIQHVENFEKVIDALYVHPDIDVYLTGSNAYFLSGDLATLLTGRSVELQVLPLSFSEYFHAFESRRKQNSGADSPYDFPFDLAPSPMTKEAVFNRYLTYGGLPYAALMHDDRSIEEYLEGVFSAIILKDIAARKPRMDMRAFKSTASFLADNIGNISSLKRIASGLSASGRNISPTTVGEYVDSLIESYLLFKIERFDLKGKEYLRTQEKYYVGDLGLRLWLLGKTQGDLGHRIENLVYLELRKRYQRVSIGKRDDKEIDFIAVNTSQTHYYQVAQTVLDESTLKRELSAFKGIEDNYPKTLLSLDTIGLGDHEGIKHVNLIEWLLQT